MHAELTTAEYVPAAQSMQVASCADVAPALPYVPGLWHGVPLQVASCADVAPVVPYVPGLHGVPLQPGLLVLYVPGRHAVHLAAVVTKLSSYMVLVLTPAIGHGPLEVSRRSKLIAEPRNTARAQPSKPHALISACSPLTVEGTSHTQLDERTRSSARQSAPVCGCICECVIARAKPRSSKVCERGPRRRGRTHSTSCW